MGVSGGLVPCPEALGVMIVAVGVNRTLFGLGLITSFSLGLAAVLMGLGILLVRSRHLVSRFERIGNRWTTVLPLMSSLLVTALGVGLAVKGLHAGVPLLQ
jgi:nickel/cobalt exporter